MREIWQIQFTQQTFETNVRSVAANSSAFRSQRPVDEVMRAPLGAPPEVPKYPMKGMKYDEIMTPNSTYLHL